ncbi:MAG TPA: DUF6588 family protein [Patescibacteria group bacterium]|nr:DUF6588 family protein [Patescibacteria group bacterium]
MKVRSLIVGLYLCFGFVPGFAQTDNLTVDVFRRFGRQLLDSNAVPFMQPLVTSINATSNARFFNQAFVPKKVKSPYFRFGIHTMVGFVRDDQKTYRPSLPTDGNPFTALTYLNNKDTAGAITELLKYVFARGQATGEITLPTEAATIFGNKRQAIPFQREVLKRIVQNDVLYQTLPESTRALVDSAFNRLPANTQFDLPPGQDMRYLVAAVPQFEIGSLFGTELLVRFIPPLELDTNVGKFAFWGVGLKHSLTQYFEEAPFDAAVQAVYQGTSLENTVGETGASLKANGTIWNVNLHASKHFEGIVDIFTGFAFENIRIDADYTYVLPAQVQRDLGIVDNSPQTSPQIFKDTNYKWVIGLSRQFGPIAIFADYSVSKFNIFSGGIEARF